MQGETCVSLCAHLYITSVPAVKLDIWRQRTSVFDYTLGSAVDDHDYLRLPVLNTNLSCVGSGQQHYNTSEQIERKKNTITSFLCPQLLLCENPCNIIRSTDIPQDKIINEHHNFVSSQLSESRLKI